MTDTAPAVASSSRGLLPPVLSASSFGGPSPSFQKAEHERKERTLSDASSGGSGTEIQTFDPEKAFGERRGSRSASTGSAGSVVGQQQQAREAVRDEARKSGAKDRMGAVEEDSEEGERLLLMLFLSILSWEIKSPSETAPFFASNPCDGRVELG